MKNFRMTLLLLALGMGISTTAQEFTGIATYKSASKMSITMDSSKVSAGEQELLNQRLMKAMQKEYDLVFNATESNWKEVEKLDNAGAGGGVEIVMIGSGGGNGLLYKNTKTKNSVESTDGFGKLFLVSGTLQPYEWQMTAETKQIGRYTCYKAIAEREITQISVSEVNGEKEEKEETKTQTITAWYTLEIPVNHGPDDYWGLPGLIMEVSNGGRVLVCSKVVLNPKDAVAIEIPDKGKKVTAEEYEEIMKEQVEKMNKMYGGGKRKGQGANIEIKIGG
ncbi:MAG: GLPGLI family protein [Flavobacteriaceae bacterium]|nr:GLPGLI family protein [Flavobacteriaceae bacterium]